MEHTNFLLKHLVGLLKPWCRQLVYMMSKVNRKLVTLAGQQLVVIQSETLCNNTADCTVVARSSERPQE